MTPEPYYGDEVDLRRVWRVIRRRRWTIAWTVIATLVVTGTYTWLQVPVWRASTLIRVEENDHSDVEILDVLTSLQRGSEIETEMRILRTRPIAEQVVDELNLNLVVQHPAEIPRGLLFSEIMVDRFTPDADYLLRRVDSDKYEVTSLDEQAGQIDATIAVGQRADILGGFFTVAGEANLAGTVTEEIGHEIRFATTTFQRAVQDLTEKLDISRADREANIVTVAYQGTDRVLVQRIPNAVAAAFISQRQLVQKTEIRSMVAFLEEQSDLLKTQLESAEDEFRRFREARQIVALGTEAQAQVQRLAELQSERTRLDAERSALANLVREIEVDTVRTNYRRLAAFPTFLSNAAVADILQALTSADRVRSDLTLRVTEIHPDLMAVERQIAELEGQLGAIGRNYLAALDDQIASLDTVLTRFGSELEEIPEKEVQFARLERQTTLLAELYTLLQTRLKEAEAAAAAEDPAVRVVEAAILPGEPISPRPLRNMVLAAILGFALGLSIAFVREYMDTRIHSSDDVEALLGLPAIARIPTLPLEAGRRNGRNGRTGTLVAHDATKSLGAEAFRSLRTNVRFVREGVGASEMVVTSPGPREGKSVTAGNLATVIAQQGLRTLLIDADLRRSVQHVQFDIDRQPGLSGLLVGEGPPEDAIRKTKIDGLDVLPGGAPPPNPAELLGGARMENLLAALRQEYQAIIIDSPPLLAVTDAAVLGPKVHGVIMVVRAEHTHRDAASHALAQLRHVGATVLGVVLNDAKADGSSYYYYRSYYGEDRPKSGWRRLLPDKN